MFQGMLYLREYGILLNLASVWSYEGCPIMGRECMRCLILPLLNNKTLTEVSCVLSGSNPWVGNYSGLMTFGELLWATHTKVTVFNTKYT